MSKFLKLARRILMIPVTIFVVILSLFLAAFIALYLSVTICWWLNVFGIVDERNMFVIIPLAIFIFIALLIFALTALLEELEWKKKLN